MHVNERHLVGKQLQQKIQVQTTFALRFSLSSEILAFGMSIGLMLSS